MAPLYEIDRELDALGSVPSKLGALLARDGEGDHALAHVDDVLDALGRGVTPVAAPLAPRIALALEPASVGREDDALPAALGEPVEPAEPVADAEPIAPKAPTVPSRPPLREPDPGLRARFEALFRGSDEPPSPARGSSRPAPREDLGRLLDQEIDPSEFPRASDSVTPEVEVVDADAEPDSGLEMLVDDDDIVELDDTEIEEVD